MRSPFSILSRVVIRAIWNGAKVKLGKRARTKPSKVSEHEANFSRWAAACAGVTGDFMVGAVSLGYLRMSDVASAMDGSIVVASISV